MKKSKSTNSLPASSKMKMPAKSSKPAIKGSMKPSSKKPKY